MLYPSRDLHGPAQSRAVRDLFQSLFVTELIHPSPKLWLFFAWISDVEIIDNSAREFAALEPDWPAAPIRLSQVLRALLARGVELRLVIRADGHNDYFIARLQTLKARYGDQIKWTVEKSFHAKGLLGEVVGLLNTVLIVRLKVPDLRFDESHAQRHFDQRRPSRTADRPGGGGRAIDRA